VAAGVAKRRLAVQSTARGDKHVLSAVEGPRGYTLIAHARVLLIIVGLATAVHPQTTAFTYQGELNANGTLADGSFDLRFGLFPQLAGGTQIGGDQTVSAVPVSDGVFTVQLDFGSSAFPGANRFLEISVRPAGTGSFTTLAPLVMPGVNSLAGFAVVLPGITNSDTRSRW
jgi:hypothetical protein